MKANEEDLYYVAIDSKSFKIKPEGAEVGAINNRIASYQKQLPMQEIAQAIVEGKSYLPCRLQEGKRRSKDSWDRQNLFVLDIDEGMTLEEAREHDFIRSHASFLHTTFSHKEGKHKFRIVFASNRTVSTVEEFELVVHWLFKHIPQADKACKDRARLFFAGTQVIWINENNCLDIDGITDESLKGDRKNNIYISPQSLKPSPSLERVRPLTQSAHIVAIENKDYKTLQSILQVDEMVLNRSQVEDNLKRIPLYEYLGIRKFKSFNDIFHDEKNPSASIFQSKKENGHWLYKCFSVGASFSGSIISVTMKLQGSTKQQAIEFLMRVFKVKYKNQSAIDYFSNLFNYYLEYMSGNHFTNHYPDLYQILTRSKALDILINLLAYVQYNINDEGTQIECYYSLDTLNKQLNVGKSQLGRKMNLFNYLGFMRKLNDDELDDILLAQLKENQTDKNRKYRSSVYVFDILGVELLNEANKRAREFLANNLTLNTLTYEGIARSFGIDRANEIFPQDINKVIPEEHDENVMAIVKAICELVDLKGWTTQQEVIESINFDKEISKAKKIDIFKIAIKQIVDDYNLEYVQLTKDLKLSMGIDERWLSKSSFPKIIRKLLIDLEK